jgi:hypothetical protein
MSGQCVGQFFWQIDGQQFPGHIIRKSSQISIEDARAYALPDNATSGVLRLEDGTEYPVPAAPQPSIREIFAAAVEAAKSAIIDLKANVWLAQVMAGVDPATATANGVAFAAHHAQAISNYELAGGHPIAAAALLAAVQADSTHAFLELPGVMQVFESALGGGQ